ncbi:MAG TPA: hypothetical protein VMT20_21920 [Terriglobia bacterium]|nr:hypothetical protein [Terriglobia bacterium]
MELETHALIAHEPGYLGGEMLAVLQHEVEAIGKMLNGLIHALRGRSGT